MAVADTWLRKDGSRAKAYGRGKRWRARWGSESGSFDSKGAAERWLLRVRTESPRPEVETVTVAELADRWLATKHHLSAKGYTACRGAAGHVKHRFGADYAHHVTHQDAQTWINELARDNSASLVHKCAQALHGALALVTSANPADGLKLPRERRRESRYLTWDDLAALAAECSGYSNMIWLLGTTGLRVGEAVALNVGDVDRARRRIRVRNSKSGRARDVPVPGSVLDMFGLGRPRNQPLLTSSTGGRISVDNWRARHFRPAAQRAGLDGVTIHDLRHAAASLAIADGADAMAVSRMLGHARPSMTLDVYTNLWDRGLDEVASRMDKHIPPTGN